MTTISERSALWCIVGVVLLGAAQIVHCNRNYYSDGYSGSRYGDGQGGYGGGWDDYYGGGRSDYSGGRSDYSGGRSDYSGGRSDYNGGRSDYSGGRSDYSDGRSDYSGGRRVTTVVDGVATAVDEVATAVDGGSVKKATLETTLLHQETTVAAISLSPIAFSTMPERILESIELQCSSFWRVVKKPNLH
ncbi:hypothetical protein BOX15_Mlig021646g1 [Macrostomum lignano]|uniref:Uncharacterized protein n=1 Tax=Macrostomum lignano TaxID=282301 RepID=A0A267DPH3_9PLAT|nr:hypothetical protein BOX15_Mlig021646g1 [Macrostomum lignano]